MRLPSGEGAYVQRGDVRIGDAAAARAPGSGGDLVATARRFLGVPYLWGGMTFHGVDCSGLVSRVYAANGIDVLRDEQEAARQDFDESIKLNKAGRFFLHMHLRTLESQVDEYKRLRAKDEQRAENEGNGKVMGCRHDEFGFDGWKRARPRLGRATRNRATRSSASRTN